ncbi:type III-B CRISPR-associated protein Cas10/Cmr2 [Thermogemmatispora aurantia]|uniref:Type III-B CRISPR-associated protein Cas10/Cmr2 n=1 Tax=Thermogemmatispora aurantia TaxID=2045279 RepID=A0A5J4K919_9CHLR|nr:type III-B CRISPR-associated protein Cas10/Cmr2 [Thermogemmatispora aurantia]GER83180.1 type III-B CRISPR-associated protein Cas10/Cmr2 [Thermogemmatispora aurantia]
MTQSYMLIFALGPVQSFIAQARKTRDLWLGSFLLSRLMEAALTTVPKEALVFPTDPRIDRTRWVPDLPNRYVAVFSPTETRPDPLAAARQTAEQSERAIYATWQQICSEVYQQLFASNGSGWKDDQVLRAIWERQTDPRRLFEIYWAIAANTDGQGRPLAYGDWFKRTSQALDARKSLRDFVAQDEPGEKSTLSGEREALHTQGGSRHQVREFWRQISQKAGVSGKDLALDGSERLDAIDTVKRFALLSESLRSGSGNGYQVSNQSLAFPSTSTMAAATFIDQLLTPEETSESTRRETIERWSQIVKPLKARLALPYLEQKARKEEQHGQPARYSWLMQVDGDCVFAETFTAQRLRTDYSAVIESREPVTPGKLVLHPTFLDEARKALRQLYQHFGEPTPYYALLQMDGDQMGTIIGEIQSQDDHRSISTALSTFARQHVPEIVEDERPGKLIYAGGDDVLAFAPLAQAFAIASTLQQAYHEIVGSSVQKASSGTRTATVSMGIAIAHHLMPLTLVRRMAREAEEQAKQRYGRNALVVTILWRSGNMLSAGCRWEYPFSEGGWLTMLPLQIFQHVVNLFASTTLSPRCLDILKRELPGLEGLPQEARCSEIARVLKRQWNTTALQSDKKPSQSLAHDKTLRDTASSESSTRLMPYALAYALVHLAALMEKSHPGAFSGPDNSGLKEVLNWLQILAFLAREAGKNVSLH